MYFNEFRICITYWCASNDRPSLFLRGCPKPMKMVKNATVFRRFSVHDTHLASASIKRSLRPTSGPPQNGSGAPRGGPNRRPKHPGRVPVSLPLAWGAPLEHPQASRQCSRIALGAVRDPPEPLRTRFRAFQNHLPTSLGAPKPARDPFRTDLGPI